MKTIKISVDKDAVSTFWWLMVVAWKQSRKNVIVFVLAAIIQVASNLVTYYATARVSGLLVEVVTGTEVARSHLWWWFFVLLTSSLVAYVAFRVMDLYERFMYFRLARWSTNTFFEQLCTIDLADYYDDTARNQINRINSGFTWQIPNAATGIYRILHSVLGAVATVITVGLVAWWMAPLLLAFIIPVYVYEAKISRVGWFVWDQNNDERHIFWGIQSILHQAKRQFEVRALSASNTLLSLQDNLNATFYDRQEQAVRKLNPLGVISIVSQIAREAIAQGWLLLQTISGALSIEQYFFFVAVVFRLDGALSGLFSGFARIQDGLKYSNDYRLFASRAPTIHDKEDAVVVGSDQPPCIEFQNATFTYPGASKPVFKGLSLILHGGEKVAIVGENGAGKSTLIKLLMRFYVLDEGRLLINGTDIRDIRLDSWLSQVATLFQDFNQYPLPAKDNISISGGTKHSSERVKKAADLAGAAGYIESLPEGYDTYLDPAFKGGVEPSGGNWQRIALARAFYRQANMIILDEPTSAIDAKAEYEIFNNIFREHDGKTALIVSHRFSTVRQADRIIVMHKGRIVEDGTHGDLLEKRGLYAEMFEKQAAGYR